MFISEVKKIVLVIFIAAVIGLMFLFQLQLTKCISTNEFAIIPEEKMRYTAEVIVDDILKYGKHNSDSIQPNSFGIMYSVYGKNTDDLKDYINEAIESARIVKQRNPGIKACMATNLDITKFPHNFDDILVMRDDLVIPGKPDRVDGPDKQWFSRLYYNMLSPYSITWSVDSHVIFNTNKLNEAFTTFQNSDIDFACTNGINSLSEIKCRNFSYIFKKNAATTLIFVRWILAQLHSGLAIDDQHTLNIALNNLHKAGVVKAGTIVPEWSFSFTRIHSVEGCYATKMILEKPQVCHNDALKMCTVASADPTDRKRMYVRTSKIPMQAFYSKEELLSISTDVADRFDKDIDYDWKDFALPFSL